MYGLDKEVDLSPMRGATLTQVCIGENEIIMNFDKPISVTILSDYAVRSASYSGLHQGDMRKGAVSLLDLISDTIVSARATDHGGILIEFRSGAVEIFDSSKQYESFWIDLAQQKIVV